MRLRHSQIGFSFCTSLFRPGFIERRFSLHPCREGVNNERVQSFIFFYRFHFQLLMKIILNLQRKCFGGFLGFSSLHNEGE